MTISRRHVSPIHARKSALFALALLLLPLAACRQEADGSVGDEYPPVVVAPDGDAPGVEGPADAVEENSGDGPAGLALAPGGQNEVTVDTAAEALASGEAILIDVREQVEWDAGRIPGTQLIPMSQIKDRAGEVPTDRPVILYCRSGNRSSQVQQFLQERGYEQVYSMQGGIQAWEAEDRPIESGVSEEQNRPRKSSGRDLTRSGLQSPEVHGRGGMSTLWMAETRIAQWVRMRHSTGARSTVPSTST